MKAEQFLDFQPIQGERYLFDNGIEGIFSHKDRGIYMYVNEIWFNSYINGLAYYVQPSKTCQPIKEQVTLQELKEFYCKYKGKSLDSIELKD